MNKYFNLFFVLAFVVVSGCASTAKIRTMATENISYDRSVKVANDNLNIAIKSVEIAVPQKSGALGAISTAFSATLEFATSSFLDTTQDVATKTIKEEMQIAGIRVVEARPDYLLAVNFAPIKDAAYAFDAIFTLSNPADNATIYSQSYKAFPQVEVDDSGVLTRSSFQSAVLQFLHDRDSLIAMDSFSVDTAVRSADNRVIGDSSINQLILANKKNITKTNRYALIVGIENYSRQARVNFASNSAFSFRLLARHILGIPDEQILMLTNAEATSGQLKVNIELLKELAEPGDEIYFYFAGHGVPGTDGEAYILPADMGVDAIHLEDRLRMKNIYKTLESSKADNVYIFVDSCFSGKDDNGELLYKGVAPIFKQPNLKLSSNKLTVMTAGGASEFANQYESEQQRLFSYYLLKGLALEKGNIDDLYDYVKRNVKTESLRIGLSYKQVPQLISSQ